MRNLSRGTKKSDHNGDHRRNEIIVKWYEAPINISFQAFVVRGLDHPRFISSIYGFKFDMFTSSLNTVVQTTQTRRCGDPVESCDRSDEDASLLLR